MKLRLRFDHLKEIRLKKKERFEENSQKERKKEIWTNNREKEKVSEIFLELSRLYDQRE